MTVQPENNSLNYIIDPTFTMSIDYFFYHLQEPIHVIIKTFFQTIMYQTLK